jgi:hypothetical protein
MKKYLTIVFSFGLIFSCSTSKRFPANAPELITSEKLSHMKAIEVLQMLKDHCCDGIMFQPTNISTIWNKAEIQDLEAYIGDTTPSAPSVNMISNVMCKGKKFESTVDQEAKHLIRAIKIGKYPLYLCSTYDLK